MSRKINIELLTRPTGDPFADTGGWIIKFLLEQPHLKSKNILELIEYVAKIYVEKWRGNLYAFFMNSTITQNQFKGREISETIKYYTSLLKDEEAISDGSCRISGTKGKMFAAGRHNHILSGGGAFLNFHHHFEKGILLSKEVLIRMFFVPLGVIQLNGKILLIQSNDSKIASYFIRDILSENLKAIASGISDSVLSSPSTNPATALFEFVNKCISDLEIYDFEKDAFNNIEPVLNLYHFTNYKDKCDIQIYTLPSTVFRFYAFCYNPKWKKEWTKFIRSQYRNSKFKDAIFNEATEAWEGKKETAGFQSYRTWRNLIFEKLIKNESILGNILWWSVKHSFNFKIVETYQTIIRNMEKRTVEKIKQFADFIVSNPNADYIKKSINRLSGAKRSFELRQFLLKLNIENYRKDSPTPLITVEDYVDYLFPDGGNWIEVRDVLLIAIYQKLHEIHVVVDIEPTEEETETITENE